MRGTFNHYRALDGIIEEMIKRDKGIKFVEIVHQVHLNGTSNWKAIILYALAKVISCHTIV